ncbi:MAG TPA: sugar ABC transporter substrate-binding protein, partial [Actinoplanes sp.]|nr:sugar ABC transporter substrate-binding protein [Actinoplanes sp.]
MRLFPHLSATLVLALSAAACGDSARVGSDRARGANPLVGVDIPRSDTDFWRSYIKYVPQFASELGVEAATANSQNDITNLIANLQTFIGDGVR